MYDPRAIANLILDEAQQMGRPVTNLALQKLLYFAHALFLIRRKQQLVSGYFEAWQYGPVHPTAYQAFKSAADQPISFRATAMDVLTGNRKPLQNPDNPEVVHHIRWIMTSYEVSFLGASWTFRTLRTHLGTLLLRVPSKRWQSGCESRMM